ncbi:MAG TPA: metal ABC transporter substrate-binding protein, partial [Burkholderiales bacterium]|nr:metal ABC transporter substrate-binding protein [Burkholderiales bacterium]
MIRCLALALAAAALGPGLGAEPLRVVTTTSDLKSLTQAVGGGRVSVVSLAAPAQDPHAVELKPRQLALLRAADLLVRIGLDHEPWLARARVGERTQVVDASRNVRLLQTETPRLRAERRSHMHAFGNTHYWLNPLNARPITAAIAAALCALRRPQCADFEANRQRFLQQLDAKILGWKSALAPYRGERLVVMHDSWVYFAEYFGLEIVAAVEPTPGVPPAAPELAALFTRMRQAHIRVLVAEPDSDPALVAQVAERSGARAVTLLPSGSDYLRLFDDNVAR